MPPGGHYSQLQPRWEEGYGFPSSWIEGDAWDMDVRQLFENQWVLGGVIIYLLVGFMILMLAMMDSLEYPDYDPTPGWFVFLQWVRSILVIWLGWGPLLVFIILQMIGEKIVEAFKDWAVSQRSKKFTHTGHLI
jgi:hypothetical protein